MKTTIFIAIFITFFILSENTLCLETSINNDSTAIKTKTLFYALGFTGAYYTASILVLNNTWYKDKKIVPFHFYNDNSGYLQVDKFGHMFGSYVYSYIGYFGLLKMGATRKEALSFGASLGFVLQFPIEIMDGIHEDYGFSWGDIAANTAGSLLVLGQEFLFNEQIIKYKFSYWESPYSRNSNGLYGSTTLSRLLKDYNGHTYWLSAPINKIFPNDITPDWFNIAIGYGANGMYGEFSNIDEYNGVSIPHAKRYRQFLFSIDIDWTKIETDSDILKIILKGLTFVKLPFPTLEINTLGKFKGYYLYY